ncbi:MAG: nicotinate-nucleotide--dimethylbenzimidazole phosphoribosyltransferase [bacterium]
MSGMQGIIDAVRPVDRGLEPEIVAHLNDLTKPRGSLGRIEDFALKYCLATGTARPRMGGKWIVCFAGDHGVAAEGVSAYPREVTPQMVMNMLAGGAAVSVLSRHVGAELIVVDAGVDDPLEGAQGLRRRKIRRGTGNIARGPAMTPEEAAKAIMIGVELANEARDKGVTLIGTGDMGIANTTPSSALFAAYLGCEVEEVTGRGTGIDDRTLAHKVEVIKMSLATNRKLLAGGPLNVLAALGGFEIAGICGLVLGAAANRIPVVVDGFISSAGALAALMMNRAVLDYMFFSHLSEERGHKCLMENFNVRPMLDLRLRLGEGTGAALAMSLIEASVRIYNEMATFSSAGVHDRE